MKYTFDDYNQEHAEYYQESKVNPAKVWDLYHSRVRFALDIIPTFRIGDKKATQKQIRIALGVPNSEWNAMVATFAELHEALNSDKAFMQFKADLHLAKGVEATEHKNAKMIEMFQYRWNEEYKPKQDKVELEVPKTLEINIVDVGVKEEDLED